MSSLECPDTCKLSSYRRGYLDEANAEIVTEHLDACRECQEAFDRLGPLDLPVAQELYSALVDHSFFGEPDCRRAVEMMKAVLIHSSRELGTDISGQTFGEYLLIAKLGQGGMGAVYRAQHTKMKRLVAVKVLPSQRIDDQDLRARFDKEMEYVGRLHHANIVQAFDAREIDGVRLLAMEYLKGTDLAQLLWRKGRLRVADACEAVRQAAQGLLHAHSYGLVHRDVKPSNLMLTCEGQIKLLDLGLACCARAGGTHGGPTITGQVLGTFDYIAPEQAEGRSDIDKRADIYGLGCTFYHLLVGQPPYGGPDYPSPTSKLIAHIQEPFPVIQDSRPEILSDLARIVYKMTAKRPDRRFQSLEPFLEQILPFCTDADLASLLPLGDDRGLTPTVAFHGPATKVRPATRWKRRRLMASIGCSILLGFGVLCWQLLSMSNRLDSVSAREATVYLKRGDESNITKMVFRPAAEEVAPLQPLLPRDAFRMAVQLSQPAYWCVIWIDTNGKVKREASNEIRNDLVEFPTAPNQLVTVNPQDPPGNHLLAVLIGTVPFSQQTESSLESQLVQIGAPPADLETHSRAPAGHLRGAGETVTTGVRLDPNYFGRLEASLPQNVRWVFWLCIPTEH